MQIQRITKTQTFTDKKTSKQNSVLKPLYWTLGTVGGGLVGGYGGYKFGEHLGTKAPMDEVLLSKAQEIETKLATLEKEEPLLASQLEELNSKMKTLLPEVNKAAKEVGDKVYPQLYKEIESPIECNCTPHNSFMIHDKNKTLCESIIERFKTTLKLNCPTKAEIVTITKEGNILGCMEKAQETAQKNGKFTILHILNFDDLINPNYKFNAIGGMKALLGICAVDYRTSVIFSSTCPEQLDNIATADHRVSWIDLSPHIDENSRPILDEFDKLSREFNEKSALCQKMLSDIWDLGMEQSENNSKMQNYRLEQVLKSSYRGLKLGAILGLILVGTLGLILSRPRKEEKPVI